MLHCKNELTTVGALNTVTSLQINEINVQIHEMFISEPAITC